MRRTLLTWATLCALICVPAAPGAFAAEEITVRGRLAPTVEAGGWLVVATRQKYLLLNAERWRNESWFRADAEVEATGETRPGAITIYQEGVPFEARTLKPLTGGVGQTEVTAGPLANARVAAASASARACLS